MTTGREAIWNTEPRMLDVTKMTEELRSDDGIGGSVETRDARNPSSHSLRWMGYDQHRSVGWTKRCSRSTVLHALEMVWKGLIEYMTLALDGET